MCVCMYVCLHVCMFVCLHACMCVCLHVCMRACIHAYIYVCVYVLCMHVCVYVCMHACMYVCICIHIGLCMYSESCIKGSRLYLQLFATSPSKSFDSPYKFIRSSYDDNKYVSYRRVKWDARKSAFMTRTVSAAGKYASS
jgi:hypothetical protein